LQRLISAGLNHLGTTVCETSALFERPCRESGHPWPHIADPDWGPAGQEMELPGPSRIQYQGKHSVLPIDPIRGIQVHAI
jgi:hypothetical protein